MICKIQPILLLLLAVTAICKSTKKKEDVTERWTEEDLFLYGMGAGTFVSLIGFIASFLLLSLKKVLSENLFGVIIQVLFAFSCGALLGETMLHILP